MCSENDGLIKFSNTELISLINTACCKRVVKSVVKVYVKEIIDVIVITVNFVHGQELNHRQFTSFLASM